MLKFLSPEKAAKFSARHPWIVLGVWVLLIVAAMAGASLKKTDTGVAINTNTEAGRAAQTLKDARGAEPATETIIVSSDNNTVASEAFETYVQVLTAKVRGLDGTVTQAMSFYDTHDQSMVSADGHKALIAVTLAGRPEDAKDTVAPLLAVLEDANTDAFSVLTVGGGSLNREVQEVAKNDLSRSEIMGLPAAMVVLVIVFGAAVAAGVPILLSMFAIIIAVGLSGLLSNVVPMDDYVENMIMMIGLAVGIDYSLFIVERFREERARGLAKVDAIIRAGSTASRAVMFSGITVIIALSGLLLVPDPSFHGLAFGAIFAAFGAVIAAMTLLPAVLSLLGDKINALHLPGRGSVHVGERTKGFWVRTTGLVMDHPVIAIVASVVILAAATIPVLSIKLGSTGISQLPQNINSVRAFTILDKEFSAGRLSPVEIVVRGDVDSQGVQAAVSKLGEDLSQDARFSNYTGLARINNQVGLAEVYVNGDTTATASRDAVSQLRTQYISAAFAGTGATVSVGGGTAETIDAIHIANKYLPIVIAFVLTLSFILLTVVFRSIVIPVKALVMNLLSVGAAYGVIILVFQEGHLAGTFGFTQTGAVASWLPVFLFAILFGLSMDYHVFLLSRIQERFLQTRDNRGSVAHGLQSTAHIITGAAAIMVVVFGTFALGDLVEIQQMGFGLAVAVFIDATLIRSILVPASMEMLGDLNWYLPSFLNWLPRINIEGALAPAQAPTTREYRLAPSQPSGELAPVRAELPWD